MFLNKGGPAHYLKVTLKDEPKSIGAVITVETGAGKIYERLKPAPQWARLTILLLGLYAFTLGDAWLGSRVYLAQLAQARAVAESAGDAVTIKLLSTLLAQASFYNENILIGVRGGVLVISILYVVFVLRGKTSYPRWMAVLNPILLEQYLLALRKRGVKDLVAPSSRRVEGCRQGLFVACVSIGWHVM